MPSAFAARRTYTGVRSHRVQPHHQCRSLGRRVARPGRVARSQHNEIEVGTPGKEFRRSLKVEGSDDGKSWSTVLDKVYLIHFEDGGQVVDIRRFTYTPSRFRYVRVHVSPYVAARQRRTGDPVGGGLPRGPRAGRLSTRPAIVEPRQPVRGEDGMPASAWFIRFGDNGELAPCESLTLEVAETEFVRPYRLEIYNPEESPQVIASGELRASRRPDKPLADCVPRGDGPPPAPGGDRPAEPVTQPDRRAVHGGSPADHLSAGRRSGDAAAVLRQLRRPPRRATNSPVCCRRSSTRHPWTLPWAPGRRTPTIARRPNPGPNATPGPSTWCSGQPAWCSWECWVCWAVRRWRGTGPGDDGLIENCVPAPGSCRRAPRGSSSRRRGRWPGRGRRTA